MAKSRKKGELTYKKGGSKNEVKKIYGYWSSIGVDDNGAYSLRQ
jgi:hypothetical protein